MFKTLPIILVLDFLTARSALVLIRGADDTAVIATIFGRVMAE